MLADAHEEARAQIAACFVDQFQRVAILAEHVRAAITDHQHALRFVFHALYLNRLFDWLTRLRGGVGEVAWFHGRERLLEELLHFAGFYVAEDRNDTVLRHYVTIAKGEEVGACQFLNRIG